MSTPPTDRHDQSASTGGPDADSTSGANASAAAETDRNVEAESTVGTGTGADAGAAETSTSSGTVLSRTIDEGLTELERSANGLSLSALSAGLELGTGLFLMAVIWTYTTGIYAESTREILVALAYASGYVFVVLGRTELFTEHTTLAVLSVLDRQASLADLGRL